MNYTHAITSKGQVTIPKEFRDKLGLDIARAATFSLNQQGEVVLARPKTLAQVRSVLKRPSHPDRPSAKEKIVGDYLAKKYGVS